MGFTNNRIDLIRPDAPDLAALGVFPVGVQTFHGTNMNQINILETNLGQVTHYDRPVVTEVWYPSRVTPKQPEPYVTWLRDGQTELRLYGRAVRNAPPAQGVFPLVILSHGYPGNRMLLSHLGENLASKGYVVASIDHADSTYCDKAAFGSTLYNRPLDTQFVMDWFAADHPLAEVVDADCVAIIGYSMGGYGALISGGAGVAARAVAFEDSPPRQLLARHQFPQTDSRLKAIVPIGLWGRAQGYWDQSGTEALTVPMLMIAGSEDCISGYETGMRLLFEQAIHVQRYMLTFVHAGHNAAAPFPAPMECWASNGLPGFSPFDHYADTVWDGVRMNNITQHFVTAFLDLYLKGDTAKAGYLNQEWRGFAPHSAIGLRLESLGRNQT
jgi:predicted dienelactone hydrolase